MGENTGLKPVFSFGKNIMKTSIYIDGYNLYYSRLRHSPYKWLNLRKLLEIILLQQNPETRIEKITYCTAGVLERFARHGKESVAAQNNYHMALETVGITIDRSRHHTEKKDLILVSPNKKIDLDRREKVWTVTEKQTDVKLALGLYRDAMGGKFDQIVLVSNDSDLEPALHTMKSDAPEIIRGIIFPLRKLGSRPKSNSLSSLGHWTRSHILDQELQSALFPENIHRQGKKHIPKPPHW